MSMMVRPGSDHDFRPPIGRQETARVLSFLRDREGRLARDWKKRRRNNKERLLSGDIYPLCEVIKGLATLSTERKLTVKDQEQLDRSIGLLVQELSHVTGCPAQEMQARIYEILEGPPGVELSAA